MDSFQHFSKNSSESEIGKLLLLLFVILPIGMVVTVGAYGLLVWLLQMTVIGLPTA